MTREQIMNLDTNENFKNAVKLFYGEDKLDYQIKRYQEIYKLHEKNYGGDGVFYSSPGRIEVCGNHTDHNNGKVLCASITVDTIACVTPREDNHIVVASVGYPVVKVDIKDLEPKISEHGTSEGIVRGVCSYFINSGYKIGGFSATTTSDVFKGAGVSSSACFEVLMCEILNTMFNDGKMDKVTKAKASQFAENVYFGKPSGLMDQSAISLGGVSYIDFKSPASPKIESLNWNFDDLAIVLTNTGGDHCDLTHEYTSIRVDMSEVSKCFKVRALRKVKEADFYNAIPELQDKVSGKAILRAMHYFSENKRVVSAAQYVKSNKSKKFLQMINESGESSYKLLQNCFATGDTAQRIPLALNLSKKFDGVKATRVHGGGFAGTIISYVEKDKADSYVEYMKSIFGNDEVFLINVRNCGTVKVDI